MGRILGLHATDGTSSYRCAAHPWVEQREAHQLWPERWVSLRFTHLKNYRHSIRARHAEDVLADTWYAADATFATFGGFALAKEYEQCRGTAADHVGGLELGIGARQRELHPLVLPDRPVEDDALPGVVDALLQ